jgi:molybdenum cofactor cytidylyltransferase
MGRPKQLLPVQGKPLLRHVVESVLTAPVSPVVVVLGANATEIAPCLDGLPVQVVVNPGWSEGLASSLRIGMEALTAGATTVESVVIALADQPDFPAGHLEKLREVQAATGRPIVASECAGVRGPPVLFTAGYFPALRALRGDAGARALLQTHARDVATVPLAAARDLDTPADYAAYLNRLPPNNPELERGG